MNIPTILADGPLQGDVSGPRSSPADFGGDVAAALGGVGDQIQRSAQITAQIAGQRKNLEDSQWVNTSLSQEKQYQDKWHADPQNNTTLTYADDYLKLAKDRYNEYAQKAPSARARTMFSNQYNDYVNSRYDSALQTTAKNTLEKSVLDTNQSSDQLMSSYVDMRNTPNLDAHTAFSKSLDTLHQNIDQMFKSTSPTIADRLNEKADVDAVYATMNYDQNLARKILDSGRITGRTYHTLSDEIDQAMESRNTAETAQFNLYRKNWVDSVAAGKNGDKIPISTYSLYYPATQANAHKAMDDAQIDTFNDVNGFMTKVESWSPQDQIRALNERASKVGDNIDTASQDTDVVRILHQRILGDGGTVSQAQKDPAGYLMNHNPAVQQALSKATSEPENSPRRGALMTEANNMILQYQGQPPRNPDGSLAVSQEEAWKYHGIPKDQISLLSTHQAETYANQVNHSPPKDVLKTLAQLHSQFPDANQWAIAFNDMVKLPGGKGIRGEFQLAALNMNDDGSPKNQYVDDFVGMLNSAEDIRKASSDKTNDFAKVLDADPTWNAYLRVLPNDNFQNQNTAAEFKNGLLLYSMGIAQRGGTSAEPAVKTAIGRLLESQLHLTTVNGTPQIIPRERGTTSSGYKLPGRTNDEIHKIGENLTLSLRTIDPRSIALTDEHGYSHWNQLNDMGNDFTKMNALRASIVAHGTFKPTPDGQAMTLYYDDGKNVPFEIRDKEGKAFVINVDDAEHTSFFARQNVMGLELYSREAQRSMQMGIDQKRGPRGDLQYVSGARGTTRLMETNWPTLAPIFHSSGGSFASKSGVNSYTFDGDTIIDNQGIKHRLLGIDTPEVAHSAYGKMFAQPYGMSASNAVATLTGGKNIRIEGNGGKDKYGRSLSYLYYKDSTGNETNLNLQLIRMGLAKTTSFDHPKKAEFLAAEAEAKKNKLGVWSNQ